MHAMTPIQPIKRASVAKEDVATCHPLEPVVTMHSKPMAMGSSFAGRRPAAIRRANRTCKLRFVDRLSEASSPTIISRVWASLRSRARVAPKSVPQRCAFRLRVSIRGLSYEVDRPRLGLAAGHLPRGSDGERYAYLRRDRRQPHRLGGILIGTSAVRLTALTGRIAGGHRRQLPAPLPPHQATPGRGPFRCLRGHFSTIEGTRQSDAQPPRGFGISK